MVVRAFVPSFAGCVYQPASLPVSCGPQRIRGPCSVSRPACSLGISDARRFSACSSGAVPRRAVQVRAVFDKFTERSIKTVVLAQHEAKQLGFSSVGTEHLLLGLIAEDAGRTGFYGTGVTVQRARESVKQQSGRRRQKASPSNELPFSRNAKNVFEAALVASTRMGMNYVAPEHICIAVMSATNSGGIKVLSDLDVQADFLKKRAETRLKGNSDAIKAKAKAAAAAAAAMAGKDKVGEAPLEAYCRDVSAEAEAGRIDPVIGRDTEVLRAVQILARRRKNNPILLGEPGVGKTAIAEGLALMIAQGTTLHGAPLPKMLQGVRVMQLDIGLLLAGAKERGELERRVTQLLAAARDRSSSLVLVIDELHTLIGAGASARAGGGLDVSSLLKPALARGELRCIGATTRREYVQYVEKDAALARRFQPIDVCEPSPREAVAILAGLQTRYEAHHRCAYTDAALERAVDLAHRYVADRFLPDKAIDVIDEAGSRARMAAGAAASAPSAPDAGQYVELLQVLEAKDSAVRGGHFEEAELLRDREQELKGALVGPPSQGTPLALVDTADVEAVVAQWTGIPVEKLTASESDRVLSLGRQLGESVVGQEGAVDTVTRALQRARSGMRSESRPVATLLFSGPTGVGKTCLTQRLAEHLYGTPDALIRLDMSEYMERHSVSKLIGPPPGYLGYGEGGKLTDAVRRRPACVILLDEVEKAHPDVFNILLQVMEDGRLTDSTGRVVSFRDALLVLTSNLGSAAIARGAAPLGFALPTDFTNTPAAPLGSRPSSSASSGAGSGSGHSETLPESAGAAAGAAVEGAAEAAGANAAAQAAAEAAQAARVTELVHDDLKAFFRPEFLNRLDDIVVFNPLHDRHVRQVAQTMVGDTLARVSALGVTLTLTPDALALVCASGFAIDEGARALRRTIASLLEDPLADALLSGQVASGDEVVADVAAGRVVLTVTGALGAAPVTAPAAVRVDARASGQGVDIPEFPLPSEAPPVETPAPVSASA